MSNVGEIIRDLRASAGVSQTSVADLMCRRGFKFSQAKMWGIESGVQRLGFDEAVALAGVLGVTLDVLAGDGGGQIECARCVRLRSLLVEVLDHLDVSP